MKTTGIYPCTTQSDPLLLVNRAHPLAGEQAPHLRQVAGGLPGVMLEEKAAAGLAALLEASGCRGSVLPVSGWRSREEQEDIYRSALVEHGRAFTEKFVAVPGCSEHETGLAIDLSLAGEEIDFLTPELPYDGIAAGLRRLAPRYGFVERYPFGKENVTGIGHEPWHFRYLGHPHALLMTNAGLTLEEYCAQLRQHPWGHSALRDEDGWRVCEVGWLPAAALEDFLVHPPEGCTLSGDNCGGYIVTHWREV